ncbi:MAG TPA: hypothetical protein PKC49_15610, partial [Phycisphaerae bacterium]|nr:hypothetical protein [Phycisphaerae bacterium]
RAWAFVGLGTMANTGVGLGLQPPRARRDLLAGVGRLLLEGRAASARTPRSAAPAGGRTRRKRGPREAGAH